MFTGIDHLVILVPDLQNAMTSYTSLGFNVLEGGAHPVGTHNALITFDDGSYLELIAFQEPEKPHDHRWYRFLGQPGLVDFAIAAENVDDELNRIRANGLDYKGPLPGARTRPDGQALEWRTAPPQDDRTGETPFLIDDISDRELRVPGGDAAQHPNGVTGIRRLIIAVRDLDEAASEYETLLGPAVDQQKDLDLAASTVSFKCGPHEIVLAYPTDPSSPLVRRIQSRGDGPFQAVLTARELTETRTLDPVATEGVRFSVEPE